jgi:ornithine carbamoyltransferase
MATVMAPTIEKTVKQVMTETSTRLSVQDLLLDSDLTRRDLKLIFDLAESVKASPAQYSRALLGKQLAMIFEKPSLRTRTTFEVGMTSMGGYAVYLEHSKPRLGEREAIKDIARNLERWVHGIVARTFAQESVVELADNASIPVINALTDQAHPCQVLADYFTLKEKFGTVKGLKLAFVGDGNNVAHSLMVTGAKLGVSVNVATPPGYEPRADMVKEARACAKLTGARIETFTDPVEAVAGAHAIYTDVWTSMGQEYAAHLRSQVFAPYQVTDAFMSAAEPGAVFMHCLPAHRGQEVAANVIDSPQSIVYDQAENRLHVQKALLIQLLSDPV